MLRIEFRHGTGGLRGARLGALTGTAERAASGDAHRLLALLAEPGEGLAASEGIDALPLGDRDQALAALYVALYGSDVMADARCRDCGGRFELRFDLTALAASRVPDGSACGDPASVRIGDAVVRLPSARDLQGAPAELICRLTVAGGVPPLADAEASIEAADPALELDLAGNCPDCGESQKIPFSMQGFLSAALRRDLRFLMREVHLVARSYRWGFETILGLSREERQEFTRLILVDQGERPAARMRAL